MGRVKVLVVVTCLIWGNGSARFAWRRIAGKLRWLATGVAPPGLGNLESQDKEVLVG